MGEHGFGKGFLRGIGEEIVSVYFKMMDFYGQCEEGDFMILTAIIAVKIVSIFVS